MATAASPTKVEKTAITINTREKNKMDAARVLVGTPLALFALGAMARGALGLQDLTIPKKMPNTALLGRAQYVQLPRLDEEEEQKPRLKTSGDDTITFDQHKSDNPMAFLYDPIAKLIYNSALRTEANAPTGGVVSWLKGDGNRSVGSVPITGLALPAGVAALYGGWHLVDKPLDNRRKALKKQELDRAQQQFEAALRGKFASDILDYAAEAVEEAMEKHAALSGDSQAPPVMLDRISPFPVDHLTGYYGALLAATALTSALGSGAVTYALTNKQSKRKTLEEAIRRRAKRQSDIVAPVFAYTR